jgi:hypothetical protein
MDHATRELHAARSDQSGQHQAGDDVIGFTADVTGSIEILTALPAITTNVQIVGPGADKLTVKRSAAATTPKLRRVQNHCRDSNYLGSHLERWLGEYEFARRRHHQQAVTSRSTTVSSRRTRVHKAEEASTTPDHWTFNSSTISSNSAVSGGGGGIYNTSSGVVTLNFSSVSANQDSDFAVRAFTTPAR